MSQTQLTRDATAAHTARDAMGPQQMRVSLRVAVPIGLAVFALTACLLVFVDSRQLVLGRVETEAQAQLTHFMTELSNAVGRLVGLGYPEGVAHELAVAGAVPDVQSILFTDEQGLVQAANPAWLARQPLAALASGGGGGLVTAVTRVRAERTARLEFDAERRYLQGHYPVVVTSVAGAPLTVPRVFVLTLIYDLERQKAEAMDAVIHQTARTVLALLLLSGLAGLMLDRGVTRRVGRLVRATEALASGDRTVRTGLGGNDDIARLGAAFDHMAEAIARERDQIERARRAAEDSSLAKSRFLATMSHEVRTPMNGIIGTADLMLGTPLLPDQRLYVETIIRSGESLLVVINDILDLSRIEAGRTELQVLPFDVGELLDDVMSVFAAAANRKGLLLAARCVPDLRAVTLLGDAVRLRQILLNLVANAITFTEHGRVVVSALSAEGGRETAEGAQDREHAGFNVVLEVTDTGVGIPESDRNELFQPYGQAAIPDERPSGGSGLGLAIVRGLVELMGGRITLDSVEGQGSKFRLELPFRRGEPGHTGNAAGNAAANAAVSAIQGRRVLLIEPDSVVRGIMVEALVAEGLRPTAVETEADAWAWLNGDPGSGGAGTPGSETSWRAEREIDLVLARLAPGSPGVPALAGRIRSELPRSIPVVAISPLPSLDTIAPQRPPNLCAVVVSPVRRAVLVETLCDVLGRHPPSAAGPAIPAGPEGEGASLAIGPSPTESVVPVPAPAAIAPVPGVDRSARILLAEDQDFNRMVALHMLRQLGLAADWADTGAKALAMASQQRYDLILMDCHMPEMDGFEATRLIRRHEAGTGARTAIIAVTADAMDGDREACLESGMDDYIAKPIRSDMLRMMLERWLPTTASAVTVLPMIDVIDRVKLGRMRHELGDEGCDAVLTSMIEDLPVRLVDLRAAVAAGDAKAMASECHKIKGVARMVGSGVLAQIANAGERIGRSGSADLDEDSLDAVTDEAERVLAALEAYRQELPVCAGMAAAE